MFKLRVLLVSILFYSLIGCMGMMAIPKPDPKVNNVVGMRLNIKKGVSWGPAHINLIYCQRAGGSEQDTIVLVNKPMSDCYFAFNVPPGEYFMDYGKTTVTHWNKGKATDSEEYYFDFANDIKVNGYFKVDSNRFVYIGSFMIVQGIPGKEQIASNLVNKVLHSAFKHIFSGDEHYTKGCSLESYDKSTEEKKRFLLWAAKLTYFDDWIPLAKSELELLEQSPATSGQ
jgi:hypothetical protein